MADLKGPGGSEPRQILENLRRLQALIDVLSWIASRFDKAVDTLEKQAAIDDVLHELDGYLHNVFDRYDQMFLLLLEKQSDGKESKRVKQETNRLRQETIKSRLESLRKQMKQYQFNRNWLEEQAAQFGANVTLEITNQLILVKRKMGEVEEEIKYLESELRQVQS